jgi:HlyD family secretion protein
LREDASACILSHVIKNFSRRLLRGLALLPLVALQACTGAGAGPVDTYQGTIELDQRVLGFEAAGRVQAVAVDRGQVVEAGQVLARLDPSLEELATAARAAEAAAAVAQVDLVRAGARAEDIRAIAARVRAAQAAENLLQRDLARDRRLLERGATPPAVVSNLEGQLERAVAERQSLEHQLRALREGARAPEVAGAEARVGTPVVSMADRARPFADVFVPQAELAGLDVGDAAHVRVDAHEQTFDGAIEHIAPTTEFTPRFLFSPRERPNLVVRVRVRIEDPAGALHAGVPAFIAIERADGRTDERANDQPSQPASERAASPESAP